MTIQNELHDAVRHIGSVTGDPAAWMTGLSPRDTALVSLAVAPDPEAAAVLAKIRTSHPTLFDPRTGAPLIPKPPMEVPEGQQGAGATAIKKAEGDLAHQNSVTAQLDLHVISAILNAHTENDKGSAQLRRLQSEIEDAVRTRTDLDTPAGARDFQRYLIGKLREIGAVVQTASLDDTSKAALAGAWTALYEASKTAGAPGGSDRDNDAAPTNTSPAGVRSAPAPAATDPASIPLPPYGAALGPDPLLDQLLAGEPLSSPAPVPATVPSGHAIPPPTAPMSAAVPGLPAGGGLPMMTPQPAGAGLAGDSPTSAYRGDPDALTLAELLAETEPAAADTPEPGTGDEADEAQQPDADETDDPAPAPESTQVRLPNGDVVNAPTPQLAKIITTALGGTPVGEAFHQHGLTIAPPGTAVPDPVDPARVSTGDVGMFTDRQALALDRTRALLGGEIQPLASVSGPSFLGWLHPPEAGSTAPTSTSTDAPATPASPPPTHPATTAASGT